MPSPKLTTRRRFVASSVIDLSSLDIGNGSLRGQSYREAERPIRPYLTALAAIAKLRVHVVRRRNARGEKTPEQAVKDTAAQVQKITDKWKHLGFVGCGREASKD
jgi:hypothetical protein